MHLKTVIWKLFTLTCIYGVSEAILMSSHSLSTESFLEDRLLSAKVKMAKRFINKNRDPSKLLNVSTTGPWVFEVGFNGGSSFSAFSQVLILADNSIHTINESNGSMKLHPLATLPNLAFVDQLAFIKAVEWKKILFILMAFRSGYCKLYTATPSMNITQRQTIHNSGPQDAEFFIHGNELFLIIISSKPENLNVPSYIYRWTGTHFDEIETFLTRGAVAVSTFPFKGSIIITVAQYPNDKPMIGSQVFRWSQNKLERMQFLATNGPVAIQYLEAHGESYLIIINDFEFSSIFWWTGREFINWDSFYDVKGMSKISIGYTEEEPLILIAKYDKIKIYKLLENKLQRLTTISLFDGEEIISMSLHMNIDPRLIIISKKNGVLSTSIFHLQLVKGRIGDYKQKTDQLLQCLINLCDKLDTREQQMKLLENASPSLVKVNEGVTLKGKIVVNGTINIKNSFVGSVDTYPNGITLKRNILEMNDFISQFTDTIYNNKESINSIVKKSSPKNILGKLHIQKDLILENSLWDQAVITEINENTLKYSNMLSYGTNQVLSGMVELGTLTTDELNVTSINGIFLEDLLLKDGNQIIRGSHKIRELITRYLYIPEEHTINQLEFSKLVKNDTKVVYGQKKLHAFHASDMSVELMRGDNVTNLKERYVLKNEGKYEIKALNFLSELIIKDLFVEDINEIQWDTFKSEVFIKEENQNINGSFEFANKVKIDHLHARKLNNTLVEDLMTYENDQEILSVIEVNKLKATNVMGELFNGLNVNTDVALVGSINHVQGFVSMKSARVQNLTIADSAKWIGKWTGKDRKPVAMYVDKMIILGNVQVEDILLLKTLIKIEDTEFKIADIKDNYWNLHQNQVMKQNFQIGELSVIGDMLIQQINQLHLKHLIHIVASDELNYVNFEGLRIKHGLDLKQSVTISGINVHDMNRTTVMNQGKYIVNGYKKFHGGLLTDHLQTAEINQKKILDMIPLTMEKHFLGNKQFSHILIKEDLYADDDARIDYLNYINVASKLSSALRIDQSFSLQSITLSTVTGNNIEVSTINEIDFDNLVKTINHESSTIKIKKVEIDGEFKFLGSLSIENVNELKLYPYLEEVVNRRVGSEVRGKKEFVGESTVETLEAVEIDGVNMDYIENYSLSKSKPQNITGFYTILRMHSVNFITEEVNGKNIVNTVLMKGDDLYNVESNIKFTDLTIKGELRVKEINNCNPIRVKSALYDPISNGNFEELNVSKNLNWKFSSNDKHSLSNLFKTAVIESGDNFIEGKVTFLGKVFSQLVNTRGEINGIDLRAIADDCMKNSSMEQELYGHKIFISSVNAPQVEVLGNANIKLVNEIDIIEINKTLVRKSSKKEINGYKHFLDEFKIEKLECKGKVNGISLTNIATVDDAILPPTEVYNLVVTKHLESGSINKINLTKFLQERVNCNDFQEINAQIQFSGIMRLLGDTKTMHINNIDFNEIMKMDTNMPQKLIKKKIFQQDILVNGKIKIDLVNDQNLEEAYRLGIQANEHTEIYGNIVFTGTVKVDADIHVNKLVNGYDMFYMHNNAMKVSNKISEELNIYSSKMNKQIIQNMELVKGIPTEYMYFEYENFRIKGMDIISSNLDVFRDKVAISLYGMDKNECYLPKGCLCPIQYEMEIIENGYTLGLLEDNKRLFKVYDSSGKLGAELLTNTISQGKRCRLSQSEATEEYSKISWMTWNAETRNLTYNLDVESFNFGGYVSDVKSVSVGKDFYLAVAVYYDASKSSHNVNSFILKWTVGERSPKLLQYIPSFGAQVLELFHSEEGVYLFIGNSYDSDLKTNYVNNEIYRLTQQENEFVLLRTQKTRGTNAAKSLIINNEKFIIVSQQLGMPVVILKYNEEYDNFYLYQKLNFKETTVGVGVFYDEGNGVKDAYLGIAVMDGSFHLYKYSHIEGFKKVMSQWQKGIRGFVPIFTGKQHLILTPSVLESRIMHIVFQGNIEY